MTQQIIIQNNIHGSSIMAAQKWQHIFSQQSNTNNKSQTEANLPSVSRTSSSMPQEDAIIVLFIKLTLIQFLLIPADSFGRINIQTNLQGITTIDALKTLYNSSTQVYNLDEALNMTAIKCLAENVILPISYPHTERK
ncbi:hypothetical protein CIK99_14165 [Prevotella sp. P5-92]|nr:hypothetical protein CIK99_14165 [Prevotella sp. P5-92]